MKDFFGEELNVGDIVAYSSGGDTDLSKGTVVKLCAKTVKIDVNSRGYSHCYRPPNYCVKNLSNSAYDE